MYNILTLNKIAACGLDRLGDNYNITDDVNTEKVDGIILRSFKMHDMELPKGLKAVARAGAGVNNIPIDKCTEKGIVVFNTPGANANAVKELVIAGMLLASRDIIGGVEWANTLTGDDVDKQVEKGKSNFAGTEIKGKTLGIIGLGAIGVLVANAAYALGMDVIGYDPYLSVNAALQLSRHVKTASSPAEVYAAADYITLHLPLLDSTRNTINAEALSQMKDGVIILNFARGGLVNNADMLAALDSGKVRKYVVDFADSETVNHEGIINIPHLGASTEESEDNCAMMAADEIKDYLENGNITNSVNFPNVSIPNDKVGRLTVKHKNLPSVIAKLTDVFTSVNIADLINGSKGEIAYTIINTDHEITQEIVDKLNAIPEVLKVRVIR
ncbi:MAG: 3-phosphoglycerate dehydrogenase [Clostridia bacterium]|nr:3-phosphoglycerate dehydrogenase [Clostridia bacterium]MBQ3461980.1 3-phosphoglycerate dehydrogenase [Clostridia bacterium]MBQ6530286.1 3-phosphoglycerate dehydrogenase [Clostridia bacterium]MBQ6559014.1 3-phosphoglycerate dehydrogenase [Clostridia bacterium]